MKNIRTTIGEIERENPYLLNDEDWNELKASFNIGDEIVRFSDLDGGKSGFISGERGVALQRGDELFHKVVLEVIG